MFLNQTKIAIVTTVHNDSHIIGRLLLSLISQSDKSFVHYIYDDGSTDNIEFYTKKYINEVSGRYDIVFLKGFKNIGVNKAHEYVFRFLKEDYFTWVDADDWVHHDFVKIIRQNIERHNDVDVFHINSYRYDEKTLLRDRKTTGSWIPKIARKESDQFPYYCLDGERFFHNFIVKKKTLISINPSLLIYDYNKEKPFWYDAQILFEMAICHSKFMFIKKPLSNILCRSDSVSRAAGISTYNDLSEINMILSEMNIKDEDKIIFNKLLPFSKERVHLVELILSKKIKEAKEINKRHKDYIKNNHYPKSYLILNDYVRLLFFRNKFLFAFKFRRFVMRMLRRT